MQLVVDENLRLVEARLNSFKAKKSSILDAGALTTSDPQVNFIQVAHLECSTTVRKVHTFFKEFYMRSMQKIDILTCIYAKCPKLHSFSNGYYKQLLKLFFQKQKALNIVQMPEYMIAFHFAKKPTS